MIQYVFICSTISQISLSAALYYYQAVSGGVPVLLEALVPSISNCQNSLDIVTVIAAFSIELFRA